MAKSNPSSFFFQRSFGSTGAVGNNLFNLKSFNELKKDQTNIKIFKNSSFDSNFNSLQNLNANLSNILKLESNIPAPTIKEPKSYFYNKNNNKNTPPSKGGTISVPQTLGVLRIRRKSLSTKKIKNLKISAILRAIRSIRLNRDEWKLIKYINLIEKRNLNLDKILFLCPCSSFPAKQGEAGPKGGVTSVDENKYFNIKHNNKIFNGNIINKNILLRNMKYNFLKSTLSSILIKKIIKISEILEDKPIKIFAIYSYLKNCISLGTPQDLNGMLQQSIHLGSNRSRTKLSLNKYKGRKFGSFINYNKIIEYKFNSNFYEPSLPPKELGLLPLRNSKSPSFPHSRESFGGGIDSLSLLQQSKGRININRSSPASPCFAGKDNIYIKNIYKLLFYLFKSMYCLISKPVLKYSNDKITIQLFYYLNIPKKKVFRLFSIYYINSIKKKWLALIEKKKTDFILPSLTLGNTSVPPHGRGGTQKELRNSYSLVQKKKDPHGREQAIFIKWKLRKAISRFKNKNGQNLLFKLRKFNLTAKRVYQNKFKLICQILSNMFNKPVELQLIRLHHPYHDSNILVNLLSLNIKNKRKKARVAIQKIYNKKPVKNLNDPNLKSGKLIPAFLSGLNIRIAGRLMGEPIIPRITTKVFGKGASATGKVNYLDKARITKKNRKGAYTIKIKSGQNFF